MFENIKNFIHEHKKLLTVIASVSLVLGITVGVCIIYISDYYRADEDAIAAFSESISSKQTDLEGAVAFGEGNEECGFIFYPGGKVEYTSYIPLMQSLAEKGIFSAVVEMPFNLAVLGVNEADKIREKYPEIEKWYIGGHSLGGSMAASYIAENIDKYEGLVLLGAYSTANLSESEISVLSLYGSEDGVMNREKYAEYKNNLPKGFKEIIIDGGNHAYFGMYGEQDGDGEAALTSSEQINLTSFYICEFIGESK